MMRTSHSAAYLARHAFLRRHVLFVCLLLFASAVQLAYGQGASGGGGRGGGGSRGGRGGGGSCGSRCALILGLIFGGLALFLVLFFTGVCYCRRRRRRHLDEFVAGGSSDGHAAPIKHNPNGEGAASGAGAGVGAAAAAGPMNTARAMEEGHARTNGLHPGVYKVSGTYTGYPGSKVNDGTHDTSFTMKLKDAAKENIMRFTGDGSDAWGKFGVDGSVSRDGTRAAFEKAYRRNVVHYQGTLSGSAFIGTWQVINDREHGTFSLNVAPDGAAQLPIGIPLNNSAHVEGTKGDEHAANTDVVPNYQAEGYQPNNPPPPPPMAIPAQ